MRGGTHKGFFSQGGPQNCTTKYPRVAFLYIENTRGYTIGEAGRLVQQLVSFSLNGTQDLPFYTNVPVDGSVPE